MPASPLFPTAAQMRGITLVLDDLTPDLVPGVRVTLRLTFTDGASHTVASKVMLTEDASDLPQLVQSLVEGFLWGEQPSAALRWAQSLDGAAQSRRVRGTL